MKVLKFGGSSVGKPERIRGIVTILKDYYLSGQPFTVVFSAFGGVVDSESDINFLEHHRWFHAEPIGKGSVWLRGLNSNHCDR